MITRRYLKMTGVLALIVALGFVARPACAARQEKSPDQDVKAKIEESFKQSGLLLGNDIQVAIANKTVTLTGTVRTLAQKEQAGSAAKAAAKGFKIANDLAVAASGASPGELAEALTTAIEKSASYFIFDYVGVDVSAAGEVVLKGWTTYPWSAKEIVKLAQSQPGVKNVKDEIQRIMIMDPDRILRNQVALLIYIRPTGPSFSRMNGPVHIIVINGVVTLGGTVEKNTDAESYERLIRLNTGAISVNNGLRVKSK